jgi:hypothetical protein
MYFAMGQKVERPLKYDLCPYVYIIKEKTFVEMVVREG